MDAYTFLEKIEDIGIDSTNLSRYGTTVMKTNHGDILLSLCEADLSLTVTLVREGTAYFYNFAGHDDRSQVSGNKPVRLDLVLDLLEKTRSIALGVEFDSKIMIEIELSVEHIKLLELMASQQGLTVDEVVEGLIRDHMATTDDV